VLINARELKLWRVSSPAGKNPFIDPLYDPNTPREVRILRARRKGGERVSLTQDAEEAEGIR